MKNKLFVSCCLLVVGCVFLACIVQAHAQTMTNGIYTVQGGNLNSFSGKAKNNEGKTVSFTSGENAPNVYLGPNYKVRAGFAYLSGGDSFSFSISTSSISFGDLNPGEPVTRTNILTVSPGTSPGYQVSASENHEMKISSNGPAVPDTTCDTGACTETTSAKWSSLLTYGFGYRCDNLSGGGLDCVSSFKDANFWKQFANISKNESSQIVMQGKKTADSAKSQISYKINVSSNQPAGIYQNTILYIATPSL